MARRLLEPALVAASFNKGKVAELAELVAAHGRHVIAAADLGLAAPAETGEHFVENAAIKARAAAIASGMPALADDSGFSVAALGGLPGIDTALWAERADGTRDYAMAIAKLARLLADDASRDAWFTCALALAWPDGAVEVFEGRIDGTLTLPARGARGFGYDPAFTPRGYDLTFGEMDQAAKHLISHRADAFQQLLRACF
ncbi:MAG: non-canonical purine NTP pyrophosphatase [Acetobacteraceae bacterium]|nr:non-canonical purine NTP pyrophosphatase [Acetobacteraceae bacterium]